MKQTRGIKLPRLLVNFFTRQLVYIMTIQPTPL